MAGNVGVEPTSNGSEPFILADILIPIIWSDRKGSHQYQSSPFSDLHSIMLHLLNVVSERMSECSRLLRYPMWYRLTDLNRRPLACKASILPAELSLHMVEQERFELSILALSAPCTRPTVLLLDMGPPFRLELKTCTLLMCCSTN